MTREEFWTLTDRIHIESESDMDRKCEIPARELRRLAPGEIASWDSHYNDLRLEAYNWDLWAVTYIFEGGCSDDMFLDFRSTLVSCGQAVFTQALSDPDSLGDTLSSLDMFYEGYQYVASEIYESLTGGEISHSDCHHPEPTGRKWTEEDPPQRFHRMFAAYWEG